jgi:hypothetical protein
MTQKIITTGKYYHMEAIINLNKKNKINNNYGKN